MQLHSGLRRASRRLCLEKRRQETCQIVYTWVMTNVDSANWDNSETTTVLSACVLLYPNSTNRKIGTKHTLPVQYHSCIASPPIAFAGLGDRSMFSNTWADSQIQVLQYQPPDFQQSPQQVSSHWEDNTTKNYQQQQEIKKRSGTGGDGKLQESSLQFLSLPISLLSIHPTIPFLDVLAYRQTWK